jgi:hypothetical protein
MRKIYLAIISTALLQSHIVRAGNMSGGGGDPILIKRTRAIFCERAGGMMPSGPAPGRSISIYPRPLIIDDVQEYDIVLTNPPELVLAAGNPWSPWSPNLLILEWAGAKFHNSAWRLQAEYGNTISYMSLAQVKWGQQSSNYRCYTEVEHTDCSIVNCCPNHPTSCGAN